MTGKEMLKLLTKHGWQVVRINGSHHVLRKPGVPAKLIVPVHGNDTLKPGTEHAILRQAKLK
jgi:predicted RNA binding protein YcfA (HicA-like mRNA interferase family)